MTSKARIEVQNQFGEWRYLTTVVAIGGNVRRALQAALRSPLGRQSGAARAVDERTGMLIDMVHG